MLQKYTEIISQEAQSIIHFSDVFSGPYKDFDAELTVTMRNLGILSDRTYFVGGDPRLAGYGAVLLNNLTKERKYISREMKLNDSFLHTTIFSILNASPREGYNVEEAPNGRDFHMAITQDGVVFFACPLETLSALETRNEIMALYRIPNEKLAFTNGKKEQFRSSIVALSRFYPESMEAVFEYENKEELVKAKELGLHPQVIPHQKKVIEYAYADRFGNVRLSILKSELLREKLDSQKGKNIFLRLNGTINIPVFYGESLSDIPIGVLGLYENIADEENKKAYASYWELVKRSDHCLSDKNTARDILDQYNKGDIFDIQLEIYLQEEV